LIDGLPAVQTGPEESAHEMEHSWKKRARAGRPSCRCHGPRGPGRAGADTVRGRPGAVRVRTAAAHARQPRPAGRAPRRLCIGGSPESVHIME